MAVSDLSAAASPPDRRVRFTQAQQRAFLRALAQTGNKLVAAKRADVHPTTVMRKAHRDAQFAERMAEAQRLGDEVRQAHYEQELDGRALAGPKDQQSAILLMFAMKKRDPSYRDSAQVTLNAQGPVAISLGLDAGEGPQPLVVPSSPAKLPAGQPE
jgi:hypothetical protein